MAVAVLAAGGLRSALPTQLRTGDSRWVFSLRGPRCGSAVARIDLHFRITLRGELISLLVIEPGDRPGR